MIRNTRWLSWAANGVFSCTACSMFDKIPRTRGCSSRARSVAVMPSLVRTSKGSPNKSRKRRRPLLMAGWVMPRWLAALVTLRSRSNTSRYTSKLRSTREISMGNSIRGSRPDNRPTIHRFNIQESYDSLNEWDDAVTQVNGLIRRILLRSGAKHRAYPGINHHRVQKFQATALLPPYPGHRSGCHGRRPGAEPDPDYAGLF